ncbi:MAG: hypothetical protein ISR95_09395 [Candidatus Marinimicrobia bacterium]|nr:hypothetical protein [Candidatus Neomarinimicrobiota bacterium]
MNLVRMIRVFLTVLYRLIGHCVQTIRPIRTPSPRLKNDGGQAPLRFSFSLFFLLLSLSFYACPVPPTEPPQNTTITLEEISTGITGTTLKVAVEDSTEEWTFTLTRNDSVLLTQTVYQKDTLITDDGLNPTTQYNYRAYWMDGAIIKGSSNLASIMTGDTTSHDFFWEIDTLGEYGSYLKDVAIINENDIWVVGLVKTDTATYNAAHWDGNKWEMKQFIYSPSGVVHAGGSIQVFDENNIIIVAGTIFTWDGIEWEEWDIEVGTFPGGINAIWGTSSSNMYFVGNSGSIVYYDGSSFEQMESGTEVDITCVSGTADGEHIFACGHNDQGESVVLKNNDIWQQIFYSDTYIGNITNNDFGRTSSLDIYNDKLYIVSTQALIKYSLSDGNIDLDRYIKSEMLLDTYTSITVQSLNDIMLFGVLGNVLHYNGISWSKNSDHDLPNIIFWNGELKGNHAIMVGSHNYGGAVIVNGIRQ